MSQHLRLDHHRSVDTHRCQASFSLPSIVNSVMRHQRHLSASFCCAAVALVIILIPSGMVYDPVRAYWESPPPWKCTGAVLVSVGMTFAFYEWWQSKYSANRPITTNPAWEVAEWLRGWNKEREAGDPVILNPFRCRLSVALDCRDSILHFRRALLMLYGACRNGLRTPAT